jgi:signal transduction histidine kinase
MAIVLIVVAAGFAGVVGVNLVGHRVRELVEHARRIGEGKLGSRVRPQGHDEITILSRAMNRMAEDLRRSRDNLLEETRARIRVLEQLRHTERVATLGQLSAGLAHEMGTPLNVISGRAKLIGSTEPLTEEARESSRIIAEQSERMTDTIRQFLDYGRRVKAKMVHDDLAAVLRSVVGMVDPIARRTGASVELEVGADVPRIRFDRSQLQQVFMNLIRNGIQAMPKGGRVRVVLERDEPGEDGIGYVSVRVEDEGIGIPQKDLDHIFEPFFSTKGSGQGVGLGLSIVQGIVEDHRGDITVDSLPGCGSRFRVRLPVDDGAPEGGDGA